MYQWENLPDSSDQELMIDLSYNLRYIRTPFSANYPSHKFAYVSAWFVEGLTPPPPGSRQPPPPTKFVLKKIVKISQKSLQLPSGFPTNRVLSLLTGTYCAIGQNSQNCKHIWCRMESRWRAMSIVLNFPKRWKNTGYMPYMFITHEYTIIITEGQILI